MKGSMSVQDKTVHIEWGTLLRTNRFAILLEIALVLLPLYLALAISDHIGSDTISFGGNVVLLGGPITYLGLSISLVFLLIVSKLRGVSWRDFGLTRSQSWLRTLLMSLGMALAVLGAVVLVINPLLNALPNLPPRDMSRFDALAGNLPNLLIQLVVVWITAGFLEEFIFRGYLMNRLFDIQGRETKLAWVFALVGHAAIFGLVHAYQGPMGMVKTAAIGSVFGLAYLAVERNLWPLIIAHGLIDSIDMVSHYLGG